MRENRSWCHSQETFAYQQPPRWSIGLPRGTNNLNGWRRSCATVYHPSLIDSFSSPSHGGLASNREPSTRFARDSRMGAPPPEPYIHGNRGRRGRHGRQDRPDRREGSGRSHVVLVGPRGPGAPGRVVAVGMAGLVHDGRPVEAFFLRRVDVEEVARKRPAVLGEVPVDVGTGGVAGYVLRDRHRRREAAGAAGRGRIPIVPFPRRAPWHGRGQRR